MNDIFDNQKKYRKAEFMKPPNVIKTKVGSGGLDPSIIAKAQETLETAKVDFQPEALILLDDIMQAVSEIKGGRIKGEAAIEMIMYPTMQLKAQGGMMHYPLISTIANILINFLETVDAMDDDSMAIVMVHRQTLQAVLVGKIKGDGGKTGQDLRDALMDACNRYYRKKSP